MAVPDALRQKIADCTSLVSLPAIAIEVLQMADDPETGLGDIEKIVCNDPALSAKIVRVANSPLFARAKNIETILQALTLLGLDSAITVALSFSLMGNLRDDAGSNYNSDKIWRRTIVAAIACRELGLRSRLINNAALFLAGLLQDIGILALCQIDPENYPRVLESNTHQQLIEMELNSYGCDHAAVGTCLAQAWRLPASIADSISHSHSNSVETTLNENDKFNLCIALSGAISDWVLEDQQSQINFIHDGCAALGLDNDAIGIMLDEILQLLPNMSKLFELELIDETSVDGILNKSKEMLLQRQHNQQRTHKTSEQPEFLLRRARSLQEMARRDSLTGLFNAHYMSSRLNESFTQSLKQGLSLGLLVLEVDNYSKLKDENGEQMAEFMLKKLANIIETQEPKQATTGRYGNETFIMLLPNTDVGEMQRVGELLLARISEKPLELADSFKFEVSCSAGFACLNEQVKFSSQNTLLKAAMAALNRAKQVGPCQLQSYN